MSIGSRSESVRLTESEWPRTENCGFLPMRLGWPRASLVVRKGRLR